MSEAIEQPPEYQARWKEQLATGSTSEDAFRQLVLWGGLGARHQTFAVMDMERDYAPDDQVVQLGTVRLDTRYAHREPSLDQRGLRRETKIDVDGQDGEKAYIYRLSQDGSTSFVEIVDEQEQPPDDPSALDRLVDTLNYDSIETEGGPPVTR